MFIHVHGRIVAIFVFFNDSGLRFPGEAIVLTTIKREWCRRLSVFDEDQNISRIFVNDGTASVISVFGNLNGRFPGHSSIFTPTDGNSGISPDRDYGSFDGDDYIRVSLVVEQSLLAEVRRFTFLLFYLSTFS